MELDIRTVAAGITWLVVALLILNNFFWKSADIWLISIVLTIIAVIVYFIPQLKK